jgi:hypothetical protein
MIDHLSTYVHIILVHLPTATSRLDFKWLLVGEVQSFGGGSCARLLDTSKDWDIRTEDET